MTSQNKGSGSNHDSDASESEDKSLLGEALKKVFAVGVGAAFMTEESIRHYLSEVKLPKEFLNLLLQQANKSKEDLVQRVGREVMGILGKIDVVNEISKFAENHRFKVTAEFEVLAKEKHPTEKKEPMSGVKKAGNP